MTDKTTRSLIGIIIVLLLGAGVAWAGSQGSATIHGWPVFAACGVLAFAVQWVMFIPAYIGQTERFYDLTGSITYLAVISLALYASDPGDPRSLLICALVAVWALRLGTFLFSRISRDGGDSRFDEIKPNFARFLLTWTLQGLWVLLTLAAGLAAITSLEREPLGVFAVVGAAIWLAGFSMEAIADAQKRRHRADPDNAGRFIDSGLWAWSRHPNYFGEIVLWVGIAIIALPTLAGWRWIGLISPVFVYLLLTRVSGVPMLEKRAEEKWGDDPDYREYVSNTPVLVPRPPSRG